MANKELTTHMQTFGKTKRELSSISSSIAAKERKIAVLKEEYHKLALESQKMGFKRFTIGFEDFKKAMQKYFKNKGVVIDVKLPKIAAPSQADWSKWYIFHEMESRHNDWMKISVYTRFDCEEIYYRVDLEAPQADGEKLKDHIKIKKISRGEENFYQLSVDENILTFTFNFESCVKFERETLMFAKNYQGAILKYMIEKESLENSEGKEAE